MKFTTLHRSALVGTAQLTKLRLLQLASRKRDARMRANGSHEWLLEDDIFVEAVSAAVVRGGPFKDGPLAKGAFEAGRQNAASIPSVS